MAALWTRWLGFVFFWALLALCFQMEGLVGPNGILPARVWLQAVRQALPAPLAHWWYAPSLLWISSGVAAIHCICGLGLVASILLMLRVYPRTATLVCLVCFLSFVATAQVFADYQSDGMLMTAALITLFLDAKRPTWWGLFSLRWLWFTIYFGSGIAKILSGDPQWRHLTALDQYYQNGPLPSWLGWYAQQYTPHLVNAVLAATVLILELVVSWLCFGPRRARILAFWLTTPFQLAIILTANYGFLNYIVLGLSFTLLDDRHLNWLAQGVRRALRLKPRPPRPDTPALEETAPEPRSSRWLRPAGSVVLALLFLVTAANLANRLWSRFPAPETIDGWLQPFRVADSFGLFATMTPARYEIEFQGSRDGVTWTPYPFRFKPQNPRRAPGLFGPYQPRFDWNLWFASLGSLSDNAWVEATEIRLLQNDPAVLDLFAGNPFAAKPPVAVRAVLWQYWFATPAQHHNRGLWWTRKQLGLYTPALALRGGSEN